MALSQSAAYEELRKSYSGSEPTLPSFLRPYYVKYNSVLKSLDLGTTEILIADISGRIGSQAGANTLYFKVTLTRDLDLRVLQVATGANTDRFIRIGILDADRHSVQISQAGYGRLNDIHNTDIDESKSRLPPGTYYITVSSDQWQAIDFAIAVFVGSYALLEGESLGSLLATARIPLIKPIGELLGSAPVSLTVTDPALVRLLDTPASAMGPQAEFLTPGTYTWVAPQGVTSVSAVCVGGGAGGGNGPTPLAVAAASAGRMESPSRPVRVIPSSSARAAFALATLLVAIATSSAWIRSPAMAAEMLRPAKTPTGPIRTALAVDGSETAVVPGGRPLTISAVAALAATWAMEATVKPTA
ncbi:MAG: hypothetical protein ACO39V_09630 [Arenicellales bacterium]